MSELKERLREVDQIPVSDLWDDIRSRPPRPELKVKGGHRGAIVIGALLLAAAALSFLVRAFLGPERPMSSASASFYIKLPSGPLGWDARGRAVLDAQTNLPAATIVQLYFFSADAEGPGMARVANGRLPIGVSNTLCHQTEVGLVGTDVRVEASVLPEYPAGSASGPLYGPRPAPP